MAKILSLTANKRLRPNPALYAYVYYVYVLENKRTSRLYIGYTEDLKRRLNEHKKEDDSIELDYYEAYVYENQAHARERKLKLYGSAWRGLKKRLGL